MKNILLWSFWLAAISGFFRLVALAICDYPRMVKNERSTDVIGVMIAVAWCVWIAWTIW